MSKVNGTHARDIALHFLERTEGRYTSAILGKTVNQAKSLLRAGYSREEAIKTIDYIVDFTDADMYSLGYVNSAINSVLRSIEEEEKQDRQIELRKQLEKDKKEYESKKVEEGVGDDEDERNRIKSESYGIQSRKREESYLDMLKE